MRPTRQLRWLQPAFLGLPVWLPFQATMAQDEANDSLPRPAFRPATPDPQKLATQRERAYEGDAAALATVFPVGGVEQHDFDSALEEDWVKFYAPTGLIVNVEARQLGDHSDVRLDRYYEQPDGALMFVGAADNYGPGARFSESLTVDLKTGMSGLVPGVYYVRVSSADTNLVNWVPRVINQVPPEGLLHFIRTNMSANERAFDRARVVP